MKIHIANGSASVLGECDLLEGEGVVTVKRYSHIWPRWLPLRLLFRIVRYWSSEKGRISDWTRSWQCVWQVRLAVSPDKVEFEGNRAACIKWEHEHLDETI